MLQLKPKHYTTEAFEKNKVIQDFKIKFIKKQNKLAVAEKKVEKTE